MFVFLPLDISLTSFSAHDHLEVTKAIMWDTTRPLSNSKDDNTKPTTTPAKHKLKNKCPCVDTIDLSSDDENITLLQQSMKNAEAWDKAMAEHQAAELRLAEAREAQEAAAAKRAEAKEVEEWRNAQWAQVERWLQSALPELKAKAKLLTAKLVQEEGLDM